MHPYDHTSPTLTEHIQADNGEGNGWVESMDTPKNQEGICISGDENNSSNINSGASIEQGIGGKLFKHTQNCPPYILKNTVTDIENEEEVLGRCNLLKRIRVSNINKLVIAQLNINRLRNKFEDIKLS